MTDIDPTIDAPVDDVPASPDEPGHEVRLTRTRSILTFDGVSNIDGTVGFRNEDRDTTVRVSRTMFGELGRPETITLTIEPGDLLNVDEAS